MIRKAKTKDYLEVLILLKQLFFKNNLAEKKTKEIFLKAILDKNSIQLVKVFNDKIIGYCCVVFREDIQSGGMVGYLSELIIDENYRKMGFGKKLLNEIIIESKKIGCKEIQFPSTFKRKRAHKFYESLDFNKTAYFFWKEI
ncbi:GNAT family N-acetyltransferase [Candidatus Pacearchaeota archaeon]|nr:GNAT family N-acetyltransferase [Candidatus Pacearchaeota archaeon]